MEPELELGLDALFESHDPQLLEPADLTRRKRLEGEVGERRSAPESKRLAEPLGPLAKTIAASRGEGALEARRVELVRLQRELIAGRARLQAIRPDHLPKP